MIKKYLNLQILIYQIIFFENNFDKVQHDIVFINGWSDSNFFKRCGISIPADAPIIYSHDVYKHPISNIADSLLFNYKFFYQLLIKFTKK